MTPTGKLEVHKSEKKQLAASSLKPRPVQGF